MCVLPMRIRRTKTDKDRINLDKKTVTVIGAGLAGVVLPHFAAGGRIAGPLAFYADSGKARKGCSSG